MLEQRQDQQDMTIELEIVVTTTESQTYTEPNCFPPN